MTQTTLRSEAENFKPKLTLNIADLDRVDLSWPIEDRTGIDKEGKEFTYKVMIVNDQEYRVAGVVLEEIQKMLELLPSLKYVKVNKKGSGLATRYAVKKA